MSITATPITFKRLVLCKQLYNQAVVQSLSFYSVVNRITAAIGFDLAIETALKAAVLDLDTSKKSKDFSQDLVQKCEDTLVRFSLVLPDKGNINRVRAIRNDAQHEARYPSESDLNDCRVYTRDFLQKFISLVWSQNFDTLSVVELVQHEKARSLLHQAEGLLQQSEYIEAAGHAIAALNWALKQSKPAIAGRDLDKRKSSLNAEEQRTIERIQDTLLFAVLGISYAHYLKVGHQVGTVLLAMAGNVAVVRRDDNPSLVAEDAEGIIAFCTDSIIQIERHVGNLDEPFGKRYWR